MGVFSELAGRARARITDTFTRASLYVAQTGVAQTLARFPVVQRISGYASSLYSNDWSRVHVALQRFQGNAICFSVRIGDHLDPKLMHQIADIIKRRLDELKDSLKDVLGAVDVPGRQQQIIGQSEDGYELVLGTELPYEQVCAVVDAAILEWGADKPGCGSLEQIEYSDPIRFERFRSSVPSLAEVA